MNSFWGPENNQHDPGMVAESPNGPTRRIRDGPDAGRIAEVRRRSICQTGFRLGRQARAPGVRINSCRGRGNDLWVPEVVTGTVEGHNRCIQNTAGETDNRSCFSRINKSGVPESG